MKLCQHTVLVTGASSGIGAAIAHALAGAGNAVLACGRDRQALDALEQAHPTVSALVCDLADAGQRQDLLTRVGRDFPSLDGVVHCAGVQYELELTRAGYGAEAIERELGIDLIVPLVLTQALLPHLLQRPEPFVVNVGSCLAFAPKRRSAVYSAAKAGLYAFSEALRAQTADTPLRVFDLIPPLVDTPMTRGRGGAKLPPAAVADALLDGMRQDRPRIFVGRARLLALLLRVAPGLARRSMLKS